VGDIHGCFDVLDTILQRVNFDFRVDRVFSVGDLVDRGAYSERVLDWLDKPWFHAVRGNHEQMAIEGLRGVGDIPRHIRNGGAWLYELPDAIQTKIVDALDALPLMIEVELSASRVVGIVHAEAPILAKGDGWNEAKESIKYIAEKGRREITLQHALYSRVKIESQDFSPIAGVDRLFVGHSTVPDIKVLGNVVYMDTGCSFDDGALSILELNTGVVTTEFMTGYVEF